MILADFIVFNANGLYCPYGDFYLDAKQPVHQSVISHAHGDHAVGGSTNGYCTAATAAFMLLRIGKTAAKVFYHVAFNQPFVIGGVSITFI